MGEQDAATVGREANSEPTASRERQGSDTKRGREEDRIATTEVRLSDRPGALIGQDWVEPPRRNDVRRSIACTEPPQGRKGQDEIAQVSRREQLKRVRDRAPAPHYFLRFFFLDARAFFRAAFFLAGSTAVLLRSPGTPIPGSPPPPPAARS